MGGPEVQNQPQLISKCVNNIDVIIDQTMCMEQDVTLTCFNKVSECDHADVGKAITRREPGKNLPTFQKVIDQLQHWPRLHSGPPTSQFWFHTCLSMIWLKIATNLSIFSVKKMDVPKLARVTL